MKTSLPLSVLVLAGALSGTARAAPSYDACTGFIDTLPATVASAGVWCLRSDLSTALGSGAAITLAGNNITLDCNGFRLGGLAAGPGTAATGVFAQLRANLVVRNCNVRGFRHGVLLGGGEGTSGHVVEDNRLDGNTLVGLWVDGEGSVVRRNRIFDTGGSDFDIYGIFSTSGPDVVDNTIVGVTSAGNSNAYGIFTEDSSGARVEGNIIRSVSAPAESNAYGIFMSFSFHGAVAGNHVVGPLDIAIRCSNGNSAAFGNFIGGDNVVVDLSNCTDGGNILMP